MQLHLTQSELCYNPLKQAKMKSIKSIERELNWVRNTRTNIAMLLKDVADVNVLIGGSYGLKYQCECFADREVTDYDFIVRVCKKDADKVYNVFQVLCNMGIVEHGYSGNDAYKFRNVLLNERYAEAIIVPVDDDCSIHSVRKYGRVWELPDNIIKAKEAYIEEYKKKGIEPRKKDISDIKTYYDNILPF
jgi:hypothetical protein